MTGSVLQSKEFLSELARYYMEFLESDFTGRTLPSRKIGTDPDSEVHLTDYPVLNDMAIKALLTHFEGNAFDSIHRDSIVLRIPDSLIQEVSVKFDSEPFDFRSIEKHINRELRKLKIPGKFRFTDLLDKSPDPDKEDVLQFLSSYRLAGFYEEIYELWKNKLMTEKHEFYIYFYDLTCGDKSYPIFYIPITVEHSVHGEFSFEFDPVLLINKKAIEYVTNCFAEDQQKEWRVELPPRHVYLANFQNSVEFVSYLQSVMNELTNFLSLKPMTLNQSGKGIYQSSQVKYEISNRCYLVLADKSDESLLNDYEELLTLIHSGENSEALAVFTKLSEDFLTRNPRSFAQEIEEDYEGKVCSERLTYTSPIPLNKEQIQVLKAIETDGCDRIIIEGPPGTGKSHTITAIIFNALMKGKSVLMVSDKKEALDVVEDKINSVLDKMKLDDFVQNPILRLGKKDTNFTSIFKTVNYEKIKTRHGAFRRHREQIENEVQSIHKGIKSDIEKEIDSQFFLHSEQVQNYLSFDEVFQSSWKNRLNQDELGNGVKPQKLFDMWKSASGIRNAVEQLEKTCGLKFSLEDLTFSQWRNKLQDLLKDLQSLSARLQKEQVLFLLIREIDSNKVRFLDTTLTQLKEMKLAVFGFLFSSKKLNRLEQQFFEEFYESDRFSLKAKRVSLDLELQFYKQSLKVEEKWQTEAIGLFRVLRDGHISGIATTVEQLIGHLDRLQQEKKELPQTSRLLGLETEKVNIEALNVFSGIEEKEIQKVTHYLQTYHFLHKEESRSANHYVEQREDLEKRLILKMTNILDDSVVQFRENFRNDAEELRKIFRAKKKIPRHLLERLVEAFPCLIVGIRELGEFIPLEANLFDLVIIDEASQVSIAQAFPAIMRGKKTVVLGDTKQFANVKSHHASVKVNNILFNRVREAFRKDVVSKPLSERESLEHKIENFNIKNSILDFMKSIPNYECGLKKHFRGYIELISYSNKEFYQDSLQVMKIRGVSIKDVIQFHVIEADAKTERIKNTNTDEILYILNELKQLKQNNFQGTVGIITPFTNQQKLITNRVLASEHWEYYREKFNLKIMTFDSCQGEERDFIYYSMVEKPEEDSLKYIFPVKLDRVAEEEDGTLKAQRLNVGFSRAKEGIRIVLSKSPELVKHEMGQVLRHFKNMLEGQDQAQLLEKTDSRSKMEPLVIHWLQQTRFYKQNKNRIEIIPQFDIGRYIKQLDPMARIPDYRIDFLMIYRKDGGKARTVIIEYDGFEYHFKPSDSINEFTYSRFYVESDVERQKTIESYGYPFVRLNKFVVKNEPVAYLDRQLTRCFKLVDQVVENDLRKEVAETYEKIENKQIKKCGKCGELKELSEYYDPNLATLYGRFCNSCKGKNGLRVR